MCLRDPYDPERFRADGHRLIDALADEMTRWHARDGVVIPWREPTRGAWALDGERGDLVDDLTRIARASTALANPRCMGHQVPPPVPAAALAELVAAVLNNSTAVYQMSPAGAPIELAVVDWMARKLGMPEGAGGVLTSGGSVGNLTALLAMRQAHAGFDAWTEGTRQGPQLAVIASDDMHYSLSRALRIMGWGERGAISAPIDANHRLTPAAVERALAEAGDRKVIGVIASAGSTATGAIDPLDELAELCASRGLWLHVDAAHGGGLALSATHRHKLAGLGRADSVVWDAHKMMMMPSLVTAVVFKRESHVYEAFAQKASYLFAAAPPSERWWDLGTRTLECTKRIMAIEIWTALRSVGEAWFGEVVDRQLELAAALADHVAAAPDFELALRPDSNIVCFRHLGSAEAPIAASELDAHNRALQQRVVEDGRFYIVGTQLPRGYFLRSTLMNPLTEPSDLTGLVDHLRALCRR